MLEANFQEHKECSIDEASRNNKKHSNGRDSLKAIEGFWDHNCKIDTMAGSSKPKSILCSVFYSKEREREREICLLFSAHLPRDAGVHLFRGAQKYIFSTSTIFDKRQRNWNLEPCRSAAAPASVRRWWDESWKKPAAEHDALWKRRHAGVKPTNN